ncbi:CWC24 Pre-mRNA-splicing factor CWC24 [Candida maltosa Xu316]|uniref:Putative membrane protein, conserved n=1 Tax=Candida maltosa (strain Xu316) TaxID=1245528 RepID=M3K8H0_CANMX|nr:putative membrane protein, conserved [Candida maltosa Xu316]
MFKKRVIKDSNRISKRKIDDVNESDNVPLPETKKKAALVIKSSTHTPVSEKLSNAALDNATTEVTSQKYEKGVLKPLAENIKTTTITDFQPDVCKDFQQTGYCGYGDTCKFLHIRDESKQKKPIKKDWIVGSKSKSDNNKTTDLPFKCVLCKDDYKSPIETQCGHVYCKACFLERYKVKKNGKCYFQEQLESIPGYGYAMDLFNDYAEEHWNNTNPYEDKNGKKVRLPKELASKKEQKAWKKIQKQAWLDDKCFLGSCGVGMDCGLGLGPLVVLLFPVLGPILMYAVHARLINIAKENFALPDKLIAKLQANILFDLVITFPPVIGSFFGWLHGCSTRNAGMIYVHINKKMKERADRMNNANNGPQMATSQPEYRPNRPAQQQQAQQQQQQQQQRQQQQQQQQVSSQPQAKKLTRKRPEY